MNCSTGKFIDNGKGFETQNNVTDFPMTNVLYNLDGFVSEIYQNGTVSATYQFKDNETVQFTDKNNTTIYFKDDKSGEVWCTGGFPYVNKVSDFKCTHYDAYTEISSVKDGIFTKIRIFVPSKMSGVVYTVTVLNQSGEERAVSVVPAYRMCLTGFAAPRFCDGQNQTSYGDFSKKANGYYYNNLNPWSKIKNDKYSAILCTDAEVNSFEGEEMRFFRSNDSLSYPYELLNQNKLCKGLALGGKPFASLMVKLNLKPTETKTVNFCAALVKDENEAAEVYQSIKTGECAEKLFGDTVNTIRERFSGVTINTPEKKFDYFVNTWLKKGLEYCLRKKDATRDNLQFANGLIVNEPDNIKQELIKILTYQYKDGHTVRSWFPMDKTYYSDGPMWIIMTVCGYLKYSNDMEFLNLTVPYFDEGEGSVYEHLQKCIERIDSDRGPHKIPLARFADWNDALNLSDENAESVFMAMSFGYMLLEMIELETYLKHNDEADKYKKMHADLKTLVNDVCWDNEANYYIRGFSNGKRIGASESDGSKIYVNPQSWSVIGGIVTDERLPYIQKAVCDLIETDYGCMVNYPAYDKYSDQIGRISAQLPGTVENGAVYCHATSFKVYADTLLGNGDDAVRDLLKIMPDSDKNPASTSGALPYAMTSSFDINEHTRGRAGRPWLTGSQCWTMNTIVEGILGIKKSYGGLKIAPAFPSEWNSAQCRIKRYNAEYIISINRTGTKQITVDGTDILGDIIPFFNDGVHNIQVNF